MFYEYWIGVVFDFVVEDWFVVVGQNNDVIGVDFLEFLGKYQCLFLVVDVFVVGY